MADYDYEFDAFKGVTRGSAVFRGSAVHAPGPTFGFESTPLSLGTGKDEPLVSTADEKPPALPYSWEICSSATFKCSDSSVSAKSLLDDLKTIIRDSPADITSSSQWEFDAVFYPQQLKTAFKVSMFDDNSGPKNSCLVEMQLQEGDRSAFQGLVSHARSTAKLVYAFADEWGFEEEEELDDQHKPAYEHSSFAPLPLPSSLLSKLTSVSTAESMFDDSKHSLADVLLENTCSQFADVRRTGWQELANASNEDLFAKSLLQARAFGKECFSLAKEVLGTKASSDVHADTQRCALRTLLNVASTGDADAARKISTLKPRILELAIDDKSHSMETRATAVKLMECLTKINKPVDKDFVNALKARSHGRCRVSNNARRALSNLSSLIVS